MGTYTPTYHPIKLQILREIADLWERVGDGYEIEINCYFMGVDVTVRNNTLSRYGGDIKSEKFHVDLQSAAHILLLRQYFFRAMKKIGWSQEQQDNEMERRRKEECLNTH